ncbi:type II CAAX endopeptidase family protein [Umezawaea sp. Da 62-37]|uniref:CPBP family intramembrane glutamic endopeptidase n=1 Tax=Umezawaea sp. Da 62-37 TaxID=3075927 RepID=UPI0028F6C279|nr:type II CAAX endopeptidase family protein [Umezawaea sp. Da 62-37]WNV91616.1 type II CAAX endopeptidase family protein [Umezawaea sp. Da 62-37]
MSITTPARDRGGLTLFWVVTFATTWTFWLIAIGLGGTPTSSPTAIPYVLGGFGPVFGAIAVRIRRRRRGEAVPVHAVKARPFWVLPLLVLASATVVVAAVVADVLGGPAVSLDGGLELVAKVGGPVGFFVSMLIGGPLAEEPGWRGTAYPRLRASMGRLQAGLLLGVVWAVWHLPLFFIAGTVQSRFGLFGWSGLLFSLTVIPMALLTGCAYEREGVPAAVAVHLGVNATMALLSVDSPITQVAILVVQVVVVGLLLAGWRDRAVRVDRLSEPARR